MKVVHPVARAPALAPIISGLAQISDRYDVILCDIWGVLHNGMEAFAPASDALTAFRRRGGVVVLISNAPRPSPPILAQVFQLGVSPGAFDEIVTSGDVTIGLIAERGAAPLYFIGPPRDLSLLDAASEVSGLQPRTVDLDKAEYVVCTGLFDDSWETPDDYEDRLRSMADRGLTMICANPDLVVHRGDTLLFCAGALAERYEQMGGVAIYAGKPHAPIYDMALGIARAKLGRDFDKARTLAIGDAMRTDVSGAMGQGIDTLFVTDGIHRDDAQAGQADSPVERARLHALFEEFGLWPSAIISALRG
jgi:HAD superfamily hydrolase (TIGR01459 family)